MYYILYLLSSWISRVRGSMQTYGESSQWVSGLEGRLLASPRCSRSGTPRAQDCGLGGVAEASVPTWQGPAYIASFLFFQVNANCSK